VIALIASTRAQAQQQIGTSFTLEQCIEYALINSVNVQNAQIDQQIAAAKVRETAALGLPQIDGSVSVQHNENLRRFFSTKQRAFGFSGLPASDYPNFLPGLGDNDVIASQNFFQLKSSGDAGINVNQLLFSGSYVVGLQASKAYKDLSIKAAVQTREQVIENVTKAYYSVLINRERADLFNNNISRLDSLLKNTVALNKNGFAESIDVDRIRVAYNNLKTERDNFLRFRDLSVELLKFQMNYASDQPIEVVGKIADAKVELDFAAYRDGWDYKTRSDYRVL
jgi:outer membrane protein TolC